VRFGGQSFWVLDFCCGVATGRVMAGSLMADGVACILLSALCLSRLTTGYTPTTHKIKNAQYSSFKPIIDRAPPADRAAGECAIVRYSFANYSLERLRRSD